MRGKTKARTKAKEAASYTVGGSAVGLVAQHRTPTTYVKHIIEAGDRPPRNLKPFIGPLGGALAGAYLGIGLARKTTHKGIDAK